MIQGWSHVLNICLNWRILNLPSFTFLVFQNHLLLCRQLVLLQLKIFILEGLTANHPLFIVKLNEFIYSFTQITSKNFFSLCRLIGMIRGIGCVLTEWKLFFVDSEGGDYPYIVINLLEAMPRVMETFFLKYMDMILT